MFLKGKLKSFACSLLAAGSLVSLTGSLQAQVRNQPVPNTAYVDFQEVARNSPHGSLLPGWLEAIDFEDRAASPDALADETTPESTHAVWRLRLKPLSPDVAQILFRLYFTDRADGQPTVTGWTELGVQVFDSRTLGTGSDLPASETLAVPATGISYLEVEVPGNGTNVRGLLLAGMKSESALRAVDFDPIPDISDLFHNPLPATAAADDISVFGRVRAPLDAGTLLLKPGGDESVSYSFDLAAIPLVAVVTFEIQNADIQHPPIVSVNGQNQVPAALALPDLADPAYVGALYSMESSYRFRYQGWLRAQCVIPGAALQQGENQILVQKAEHADGVAIRAVEIQLKYKNGPAE